MDDIYIDIYVRPDCVIDRYGEGGWALLEEQGLS